VPRRPEGRLADKDPVRRRRRLQPRGRVDDVARRHAFAFGRASPECHQGLAGRHGDPYLQLTLLDGPVADRERGAHGPDGVVLVRRRSPEERHHRVADELLDRSAVALELGA
jgi:hypothetical protein